MVPMTAAKRVKYPHGPTGREYAPGETFHALSDRDAKGLYVSGKATYGGKVVKNKTDMPKVEAKAKEVAEERAPLYQRRDMRAEIGPTGEDKSPPSSRRGRLSAKSTPDSSGDDAA
jgi:hypothetical protein